ncbi:polyprenyl synthetase family protein [Collinsella vaginalis]|uniref:polyprenyl synthetase family protein n=1 Tax=Collinsella vaginalis TaxID=1870987 RepID=UPI000A26BAB1|nr:polyprenyl synthetase family protein [Collinsella vaginalis]
MKNPFVSFLEQHVAEINAHLIQAFQGQTENADIDAYLYAPLARFAQTAGKRHRPLICMLACQAVGGEFERALSAATAIEHFQSAALIHDDIADHGTLRRGEPCMYLTAGEGIAINCGDLALSLVTGAVLRDAALDDALKVRLLHELVDMTTRTIEGQALDLGWVRDERFDLSVDDYLTMATLKTAHYSGATPLACGAIIGGGTEEQVTALRSFGLDTGLAFQIQDDLLNLIGEKNGREKDFRTDITEGKRTLVAVHALSDPQHHDEIEAILRAGTKDEAMLARAVELFEETGSIAFARAKAEALIARAKATLSPVKLEPGCKKLLMDMADFFVSRLR